MKTSLFCAHQQSTRSTVHHLPLCARYIGRILRTVKTGQSAWALRPRVLFPVRWSLRLEIQESTQSSNQRLKILVQKRRTFPSSNSTATIGRKLHIPRTKLTALNVRRFLYIGNEHERPTLSPTSIRRSSLPRIHRGFLLSLIHLTMVQLTPYFPRLIRSHCWRWYSSVCNLRNPGIVRPRSLEEEYEGKITLCLRLKNITRPIPPRPSDR